MKLNTTFIAKWIQQGAIFGSVNGNVHLFAGQPRVSSRNPVGQTALYSNDFLLQSQAPWFVYEEHIITNWSHFVAAISEQLTSVDVCKIAGATRRNFLERCSVAINQINAQNLKKIVVMTEEQVRVASTTITNFIGADPEATNLIGQWDQKAGTGFCAYTPELLFKRENHHHVSTMALAGTRANDKSLSTLMNDPKIMKEHAYVIEDIISQFDGCAKVSYTPVEESKLKYLVHLKSDITLALRRGLSFESLVQRLHPTAALGSLPRLPLHKDWFSPYRGADKLLGAPFGIRTSNHEEICAVNIRGLSWENNIVTVRAGCGVTAESHLESEWQEVQNKIQSIKLIMRLTT